MDEQTRALYKRFWWFVLAEEDTGNACWLWGGSLTRKNYALLWVDGRHVPAHRWAWEQAYGTIPDGLQIDHLCRRRPCVYPNHLEPVTGAENCQRGNTGKANNYEASKTHCPWNHPYSGSNLYTAPKGDRRCRLCKRKSDAKYYKARKKKERGDQQ